MENRQQALYWNEMVDLKVACEYTRRYRDTLAAAMTRRCISQRLGHLGGGGSYPMLWGGIIAAAQVADALQNAIPFAARFRGTNALSATLDALFIACQMEWEEIFPGGLAESEITKRRHKLMMLRHEADLKNLPNGLPQRRALLKLAEADPDACMKCVFPDESA